MARHEKLLAGTTDAGCAALLAFLRQWSPDRYETLLYADAMLDQNVAFRLEGDSGFIHDRPAARAALIAELGAGDAAPQSMCLVTGGVAPIARLHPSIKGVPGAQPSGAALVSFNLDSSTSHGKIQGANAPVSEAAAFAYATALNGLLTASHSIAKGRPIYPNRVMLGETTVPFWAEHGSAESIARALIGGARRTPRTQTTLCRSMERPRPVRFVTSYAGWSRASRCVRGAPEMATESQVYVFGLSPNAARLSVRFWVEQSLADFTRHFQLHWDDLRLEPPPHPWPPPLWRLLLELAPQRKSENIPPNLGGEVMRAILTGLPYPRALLVQTLMRIRADGDLNAPRVALAKAVIMRVARREHEARLRRNPDAPPWEDPLVALDREENNVGYRLGRLFALLDYAQYLSVGSVNAGIKERFFASASSTPRRIFPSLLRMSQNHLSDARKSVEKRDHVNHTDSEIKQVMDGLEAHVPFPTILNLDDQGRFIVGFYHQRPGRRGTKTAREVATGSEKDG